jgi:DNA-binding helix-hairpin-helix protein with protein kinase domain
LYAFQYDKGTEAYNRYRAGLRSTPSGALNRAPKEAHYPFCSSCQMRRVDILEAKKNEQLEAQREEEIRQQKKMLQSQGAKSALDAILKNLS